MMGLPGTPDYIKAVVLTTIVLCHWGLWHHFLMHLNFLPVETSGGLLWSSTQHKKEGKSNVFPYCLPG